MRSLLTVATPVLCLAACVAWVVLYPEEIIEWWRLGGVFLLGPFPVIGLAYWFGRNRPVASLAGLIVAIMMCAAPAGVMLEVRGFNMLSCGLFNWFVAVLYSVLVSLESATQQRK